MNIIPEKICLIRQPAGIGDIFFTQKIAKDYISKGYLVVWPVIPQFEFIKDYIKVDNLMFVNENSDFPHKNIYQEGYSKPTEISEKILYLPIQHFDRHHNGSVMHAKYKLLNMDFGDWLDYFSFERNLEREQKLINHFDVNNKKFVLVNRMFGSPPDSKPCPHMGQYDNSIEMTYLGWDNLFDWIGLLLKAKHIYTVETSILYIINKLGLKNLTLYSRHSPGSFHEVEHIFDKDLKYIL
jgi:hypothetical protein